jgi:protoporphyrinogen/coproporphyrinogen III oxidase
MGADVQVVGGGFSGLAVAYFFAKAGRKVRLVEKAGRQGGMIRTLETPYGPAETAANALLSNALVESTAQDLGIELVATLPSSRKRFILRAGRMRRWPLSLSGSWKVARAFFFYFLKRQKLAPEPRESISDWGNRVLGEEATNYLLVPALSGIYAGAPESLSASLILGRFFRGGRVPPGKLRGSVAPLGGMQNWISGFTHYLKSQGVEFSNQAEECIPTVVALPPHQAREFLAPRSPRLAAGLEEIETLSLLSVNCFFEGQRGIDGFGCLFPRSEGFRVLGVLANDRIFPGRAKECISETWIFGGATDPAIVEIPEEELLALIRAERSRMGLSGTLLHAEVNRWPRAIPHYNLALEKALEGLAPFAEGHYRLFGTYLGDLGLARVLGRAQELVRSFP